MGYSGKQLTVMIVRKFFLVARLIAVTSIVTIIVHFSASIHVIIIIIIIIVIIITTTIIVRSRGDIGVRYTKGLCTV